MLTVRHFSEEMNIFLVASLNWKQTTSSILAFSSRTFVGTTVAKAMGWFYFKCIYQSCSYQQHGILCEFIHSFGL